MARRPDPGPLHPAPGRCRRDVRRVHRPDGRRGERPPPRRDHRPPPHPRPAGHPVVAGRPAPRDPPGHRPPGHGRPPRRRWLALVGRRPGPSRRPRRDRLATGTSATATWPSPTSRCSASRAGGRRSPRRSTAPSCGPTSATSGRSTCATRPHAGAGSGGTNLIKPLYHVAWLASRLEMAVVKPLEEVAGTRRPRRPRGAAEGRPPPGPAPHPGPARCPSSRRCPPARPSPSS